MYNSVIKLLFKEIVTQNYIDVMKTDIDLFLVLLKPNKDLNLLNRKTKSWVGKLVQCNR